MKTDSVPTLVIGPPDSHGFADLSALARAASARPAWWGIARVAQVRRARCLVGCCFPRAPSFEFDTWASWGGRAHLLHEALVNSTRDARGPPLFPLGGGSRGASAPRGHVSPTRGLVAGSGGSRGPPRLPSEGSSRGARGPVEFRRLTCKELQLKRAPHK